MELFGDRTQSNPKQLNRTTGCDWEIDQDRTKKNVCESSIVLEFRTQSNLIEQDRNHFKSNPIEFIRQCHQLQFLAPS